MRGIRGQIKPAFHIHAFQLGVIFLQLAQLRDRHARELAIPLVLRQFANTVLPVRLDNLHAKLDLLEDADYLRFTESGFLHVETRSGEMLYLQVIQAFKGTST